jgi:hypothetical protein
LNLSIQDAGIQLFRYARFSQLCFPQQQRHCPCL